MSGVKYLLLKTLNHSGILALLCGLLSTQIVLAAPSEQATPVTATQVVSRALRETLPLSATAEALMTSEISPQVDGVVEKLFVDEGEWVEKGQKLLSLDRVIEELEVAAARARVNEAAARHKDVIRQRNEYQSLQKRKAVAESALNSAIASEEAARAILAREQAELKRLQELLARHTLTAPFAGVVAQKYAEVGQWVKNDAAVIKLLALDTLRVRAALPQRYYARLSREARVRVVFDALPERPYFGDIAALLALGNERTRTFPLLVDLDNRDHTLAAGMSARIFVELSDSQAPALMLPRDAVVQKPDGSRVAWRMVEKDDALTVQPVKLQLGRAQGEWVEVLDSPLQAGDRVVMLGNENLRPNQAVRIKPAQPDES